MCYAIASVSKLVGRLCSCFVLFPKEDAQSGSTKSVVGHCPAETVFEQVPHDESDSWKTQLAFTRTTLSGKKVDWRGLPQ